MSRRSRRRFGLSRTSGVKRRRHRTESHEHSSVDKKWLIGSPGYPPHSVEHSHLSCESLGRTLTDYPQQHKYLSPWIMVGFMILAKVFWLLWSHYSPVSVLAFYTFFTASFLCTFGGLYLILTARWKGFVSTIEAFKEPALLGSRGIEPPHEWENSFCSPYSQERYRAPMLSQRRVNDQIWYVEPCRTYQERSCQNSIDGETQMGADGYISPKNTTHFRSRASYIKPQVGYPQMSCDMRGARMASNDNRDDCPVYDGEVYEDESNHRRNDIYQDHRDTPSFQAPRSRRQPKTGHFVDERPQKGEKEGEVQLRLIRKHF